VRRRIGDDVTERNHDEGYTLRVSGEYEVIKHHWMPTWVEFQTDGYDGPDTIARVEVRNGAPQVVRLEWLSRSGQTEIRPRDLRAPYFEFDFLTGLFACFTLIADPRTKAVDVPGATERGEPNPAYYAARKFIERQRRPEGRRASGPALDAAVAEVYRRNINGAPTQAVAKAFGVKSRMASTYVDRARQAGLLPQTKQGKKKA